MSRAYEASIRSQLARLNRWIEDSELLASKSNDEDTLRNIEADLARWRDSREQYEAILRRTKWLNRFVSWTFASFWISFALLCTLSGVLSGHETLLYIVIAVGVLLVIASGVMCLIAIAVRDAVALGHRPWHFSVRSLLIVMTLFALVLGLWVYAARS